MLLGLHFFIECWSKFLSSVCYAISVILGEIPSPGKNSYKLFQLRWVKSHRSGKTDQRGKPKSGIKPEWRLCFEAGNTVTLTEQSLLCLCEGNKEWHSTSYSLQTFCTGMAIIFDRLSKLSEVVTRVICDWEVDLSKYCLA